jgi:hypothetical protein
MQRHKAGVRMMGWGSFSGGGGGIDTAGNGLTLNGTEVDLGGTLDGFTDIELAGNEFRIGDSSGSTGLILTDDLILLRSGSIGLSTDNGVNLVVGNLLSEVSMSTPNGFMLLLSDSDDVIRAITPNGHKVILDDAANAIEIVSNNGNEVILDDAANAIEITSNNPVLTKNFWVTEAFVQGTTSSPGVTNMLAIAAVANKMYRISIGITATAVGVGGSVQSQINWTDINGNSEQFLDAPITFIGNPPYRPVIINAEPATSINVDVNITSPATISYQVSIESQLLA